ncbi:hypothetical protein ACFSTC_31155 [Nonomuraea ferruginea]
MRVGKAVETARRWVRDEGARLPGFGGAFLTGSALWAPPGSALPPHSDVDVMVVLDEPAGHGRKVRYGGALLDVSFLPATRVESAEAVLRDYHLARRLPPARRAGRPHRAAVGPRPRGVPPVRRAALGAGPL